MQITLYTNNSENIRVNKNLTLVANVDCVFKEDSSIENPELVLKYDADILSNVNYMYVPKFGRFYYCYLTSMTGGRIGVQGEVDVLMSFKDTLLTMPVILDGTEEYQACSYLPSDIWVRTVKDKTDIINFPNSLSTDGKFILITAGG